MQQGLYSEGVWIREPITALPLLSHAPTWLVKFYQQKATPHSRSRSMELIRCSYRVKIRSRRVTLQHSLPWIHWSSSIAKPYNNHSHRSFGEGVNGHKDGAFGPGGIPLLLSVVFNVVPYFVIMVILGSPSPFLIPVLRWWEIMLYYIRASTTVSFG